MSVVPYDDAISSVSDLLKELAVIFKPSERKRRVKAIRAANKGFDMVIEDNGVFTEKRYKEFKNFKEVFDNNIA